MPAPGPGDGPDVQQPCLPSITLEALALLLAKMAGPPSLALGGEAHVVKGQPVAPAIQTSALVKRFPRERGYKSLFRGLLGRQEQITAVAGVDLEVREGELFGLLGPPRLLFVDEPTRSLDPLSARAVRRFLRDKVVCSGRTMVLATHHLGEAEQLCDRLAIMHRGKVL